MAITIALLRNRFPVYRRPRYRGVRRVKMFHPDAGVYGMNFKNVPEYDRAWGYQFGWALIILTTLIPLAIFRWRKWI
jgi:hypothetical protein